MKTIAYSSMMPCSLILFTFTLCCVLLPHSTQAISFVRPPEPEPLSEMPSTNAAAKYYRDGANAIGVPPKNTATDYDVLIYDATTLIEVSESDGNTILTCLLDSDTFKTWRNTLPPGIVVKIAPDPLFFQAVDTKGLKCTVWFSRDGGFVTYPKKERLVIPDKEREILAQIFAGWLETDKKRIASQPLPCLFIFGSLPGVNSLSATARLFYGDATKWPKIYEANKTVIKNPNIIQHGTLITIPKL
jgi:hypothetical protein